MRNRKESLEAVQKESLRVQRNMGKLKLSEKELCEEIEYAKQATV